MSGVCAPARPRRPPRARLSPRLRASQTPIRHMTVTLVDGRLTEPKAASSLSTIGPIHRFSYGCAKPQHRTPIQFDLAKHQPVKDMTGIIARSIDPPQDQPARWLRGGSVRPVCCKPSLRSRRLSAVEGCFRGSEGGRPATGSPTRSPYRASSQEDPELVRRCAGSMMRIRCVPTRPC